MRKDIIDSDTNSTWTAETSTSTLPVFDKRTPFGTDKLIGSPVNNFVHIHALKEIKTGVLSFLKEVHTFVRFIFVIEFIIILRGFKT